MFLAFLFKWAIALTLLYSLYGLLLRRETFYRVNRFVLLAMLPLSAWLATLRLETTHITAANQAVESTVNWLSKSEEASEAATPAPAKGTATTKATVREVSAGGTAPSAEATAAPAEATATTFPHSAKLLLWLYLAGLAVVALQYLFALIQVVRIIRKSRPTPSPSLGLLSKGKMQRGEVTTSSATLSEAQVSTPLPRRERLGGGSVGAVLLNDAVDSPFSWFRWIVISSKDLAENGRVFLAHERAHVSHGHSWDMLLCEFCVRLQWFNPFAWQLREDLRAVHEFQADQSVIHAGCNVREYNMLLIDKALGGQLAPVANALTQGELKNRIRMMHRKPSPWMAVLKVLYIVPFAFVTLAIFAKPIAVQNIVNARSASSIINNLKYVVSLSPEDALPEVYDDELPKAAPVKPAEVATPLEEAPEPSAAEPIENTPAAVAAKQQARIAEIKATNDYQRQRAEKAVADYLQLRVNTHATDTYIAVFINIILDREGNVTDVELPGLSKEYTTWDPAEVERHVRNIPHELTRDYVDNLPSPSNENVLRIELHQYLDL